MKYATYIFIAVYTLIISASLAHGADPLTYTLLEPSIQLGPSPKTSTNLLDYIQQLFLSSLIMAVFLTVVMVTVAGIQYMSTDSWSGKKNASATLQNAFFGLGLALFSWMLLHLIDPDLVKLKIDGLSSQ